VVRIFEPVSFLKFEPLIVASADDPNFRFRSSREPPTDLPVLAASVPASAKKSVASACAAARPRGGSR